MNNVSRSITRMTPVLIVNLQLLAGKSNSNFQSIVRMNGSQGESKPTRGALIVFEGCDRSGKTTQCGMLMKSLEAKGHPVKLMKFPGEVEPVSWHILFLLFLIFCRSMK